MAIKLLSLSLSLYAKLRVVHAPGMPGTCSSPSWVSDPDMHHGTCVTHVPWCMSGSLTSDFLWSRWWRKRFRQSRRMHNPQICVSGKRPIAQRIVSICRCHNKRGVVRCWFWIDCCPSSVQTLSSLSFIIFGSESFFLNRKSEPFY